MLTMRSFAKGRFFSTFFTMRFHMRYGYVAFVIAAILLGRDLRAQDLGTASGAGKIEVILPSDPEGGAIPDPVFQNFNPIYSFAFEDDKKFTWLVLTEKKPDGGAWSKSAQPEEFGRLWCEKEKTPFVAVKLDKNFAVELLFLCPANGGLNTEMLNTANGLESIVVSLSERSAQKLKGTLTLGQGSCPDESGQNAYCDPRGNFSFDAPVS